MGGGAQTQERVKGTPRVVAVQRPRVTGPDWSKSEGREMLLLRGETDRNLM